MSILTVISFTADNAPIAERLCDWIFHLSGRNQKGHALLVAAADVHKEMCAKTSIAAEVAFESSELIVAPDIGTQSPVAVANQMFKFSGDYIVRHFKCPWLWLEPNCVPLKPDWREILSAAYDSQPKRYMGSHLRLSPMAADSPERLCLSRCSIYPYDAIGDMSPFCDAPAPFQISSAQQVLSRSTKSRLIQELIYSNDPSKVRPDACVLNGDKSGELIEHLRASLPHSDSIPATNGDRPKMSVDERMAKARAARGKVGATQMARL